MAQSVSIPTVLFCLGCAGPGWPTAGAVSPHTRCSSDAATCAESAVRPAMALAAPGDTDAQFSLLQRSSSQQDPGRQAARLEALRPIAWMHVPKCGGSFLNFLVKLPGNCPGIPEDVADIPEDFVDLHSAQHPRDFNHKWDILGTHGSCPGAFAQQREDYHNGFRHEGIGKIYDAHKGHWVTMLRQPEQRLVSAYNFGPFQHWSAANHLDQPRDLLEYAQVMAGCAVKQMTLFGRFPCERGAFPPPDEDQVAKAIERLSEFSFVGLVDEWALSMCLGHRMFGGHCRSSDFQHTREGVNPGHSLKIPYNEDGITHDTSELQGFHDPYDGPLYEAAKKRFKEDCAKYNVSVDSCRLCFQEAGVTVSA